MSSFQLCADFRIFEKDSNLGFDLTLSGFYFAALNNQNKPLRIVNSLNENALELTDEGVEITLPTLLTTVSLRIARFGDEFDIVALDTSGREVRRKTIPQVGRFVNVKISAPEIATLILSGGGGEVELSQVCAVICCANESVLG